MNKIPVDLCIPNPQQPRTHWDMEALEGLAGSMREKGQGTPILVEDEGNGTYIIVQGERRWRAAIMNNWTHIDAIIRAKTNHEGRQRLEDAMIENVARNDMNIVDEARGFKKMRKWNSVKDISIKVGKTETYIRNRLIIAELDETIQEYVAEGKLPADPDACRGLLSIPRTDDRMELAKELASKRTTGKMVVTACKRFMEIEDQVNKKTRMRIPAMEVAKLNEKPTEWDALYQINKVPEWQKFTESVMSTCDSCSLRDKASDATCRDCPLVIMCRNIMEKTK